MNIVLTTGCVCDSLMIDDKGVIEYSNDELKDIIKKILALEKSKFNLTKLLGQVVEIFDDEWYTDNIKVNTVKYGLIELESFDIDVPNITINGNNIIDFTEDEIRDAIINIVSSNNDNANLIWTLRGLIQNYGKYKFCYHCDECGDNVVEYKLTL